MLRSIMISLAAATALTAAVGCASSEGQRIREAQEATCRTADSTADAPVYDQACMTRVAEQIRAAKTYRPSTKGPRPKT